jgi:preprotein translocase subunit SecD
MYKNLRWKILATVLVTGLAVWSFTPPSTKIKLGLDLRGGVHLVMKVKTDEALKAETETAAGQFQEALKTANIPVSAVRVPSVTELVVEAVPSDRDQQFRQLADQHLGTTFDRETGVAGSYTFRMKPNVQRDTREDAVTQALQTIERRVNEYGVSEPVVAPYGTAGDQIVVQLPGVDDLARAKELIRQTAQLQVKLVEAGPASDEKTLLGPHNGQVPPDLELVPGVSGERGDTTRVFYLVRRVAAITGADLRNAKPSLDEFNQPAVSFTLNNDGVAKFTRATEANVGRQLAIILDNTVRSAPVIETRIAQAEARITGSFTQQEAQDLALVLRSGALPASLDTLEQREIGPSLGRDSIRAGIIASIVGLGFVAFFMLIYYKLAGINAIMTVALNLVILLGFMAYAGAVMTLPGIAGFILTIGIGVDSNVLIFERIREELAAKKGARQALAAGFDRVFLTILDTHIASLISAAFLFQFGTGPIRGFATTLFFGLLSNVFTAVFVSRTLFEIMLSRKPAGAARLSI